MTPERKAEIRVRAEIAWAVIRTCQDDKYIETVDAVAQDCTDLLDTLEAAEAERSALKDALINSCDLLEHYIDTFGDMSGANRADVNDFRDTLSLALN